MPNPPVISAPPGVPVISNPTQFRSQMDAWIAHQPTLATELTAFAAYLNTGTFADAVGDVTDGAIMEYGTNANGTYLMLQANVMICYNVLNVGAPNAEGAGNINTSPFRTAAISLPFAATFSAAPIAWGASGVSTSTGTAVHLRDFSPTCSEVATSSITGFRFVTQSNVADSTPVLAHYWAIGTYK